MLRYTAYTVIIFVSAVLRQSLFLAHAELEITLQPRLDLLVLQALHLA